MKKLISKIMTLSIFLTITYGQTKRDVKYFYNAIEAESDVKILTTAGEFAEAEYIRKLNKND